MRTKARRCFYTESERTAYYLSEYMRKPWYVCESEERQDLVLSDENLKRYMKLGYPKEKGAYRMDVTACPYFHYFTELGCPELTKIFCENDERIYGNLPGIQFTRTGTLGKGASRCDFYIRKV